MDTSVEIFHANCLMTWDTHNCPVCYYIKNPDLMKNSACMKCDGTDGLWFCIICAHVGCGHTEQGHALEHFKETKHEYAMELLGFKVWDYKMKKFLHKMEGNDQHLNNFLSYNQITPTDNACSCPVCQHIRTPKLQKQPVCMKCEDFQKSSLWICLFCSHIGCGRNYGRHALEHYNKTKHPYSMKLNNFSIWDYKDDKYLHRQLHEAVIETEINEFGPDNMKEDFEKRMLHLEHKWKQFSELTEVNKKMITVEERLLTLTYEKRVLEEKLYEHDAKLNELLTQFAGNCNNNTVLNPFALANTNTANNGQLRNLKLESNLESFSSSGNLHNNNNVRYANGISNSFISLIILGLFIYYFFRLILQKVAESLMNF